MNKTFLKKFFGENIKNIISILYAIGLLGMFAILVLIFMTKEEPANQMQNAGYEDISESWTLDKNGQKSVDVRMLGKYMDAESGVLSIYYQLPQLQSDIGLIYRSKDVYTSMFVDGQKIYETSVYDSKWYNSSPGNLWNVLTINSKYSGKCIEMQIHMVYDNDAVTVDSLMLGDKTAIILSIVGDNMFGIMVSLLLILTGVVLIVIDFLPSYERARKNHSLFWVGLFAFLTGIWCLIETNVLQFGVKDMRILQLIDNMIMIVDSMPLLMYLECEYEIFKHRIARIIAYINVVYILVCVGIQYVNIIDLHNMLHGAIMIMMATDAVLFIWVICMLIKRIKEKQPILNCTLQIMGICSLWILGILESVRSLNLDRVDRAGLVRVGMLLLCLFFAASSQIEAYKIVMHGLKYDLISKLAYSDGLTGLGNRTAYMEQLEAYESVDTANEPMQLGIVYFDVNNLKKVNDKQGHEVGDQLIQAAADIIKESFGLYGKSYRIGGDEFCVLMTGDSLCSDYEKGQAAFVKAIQEKNNSHKYDFDIQIAHGFAVCEELTNHKIDEAVALADSRMYEDKMKLKSNCNEKFTIINS